MSEKKTSKEEEVALTASDLEYILEVNKKAIEINIEVEKQNDQVLENLEKIDKKIETNIEINKDNANKINEVHSIIKDSINKKIEAIEKSIFQLTIIVGSSGVALLVNIVVAFIKK